MTIHGVPTGIRDEATNSIVLARGSPFDGGQYLLHVKGKGWAEGSWLKETSFETIYGPYHEGYKWVCLDDTFTAELDEVDSWMECPKIENLVKAGALIAAEIDRLHRIETKDAGMTFGEMVRGCRVRAGMTQEGLAGKIGKTAQYLSDIERGKRGAPVEGLIRGMAEALGQDGDVWCLAGGRVPREIQEMAASEPAKVAEWVNGIQGGQ